MNREQLNDALSEMRAKALKKTIPIVWSLALLVAWALTTVENNAKAEMNEVKATVNSWIEIKNLCDELFIQEVNNVKIWEQNIDWVITLLHEAECDYTFQQVADAIWFDDWLLCPVELWEKYWWQCTEHLNDWHPGKLNAEWTSQAMPEVKWKTSHERFKELCEAYWLPAGLIREVENRNNIREWVILAIIIAETSWGKFGYWVEWCHNIWNVGNNDRWDRVCYDSFEEWLEKIAQTLNNSLLWTTQTLGCLSRAGSCKWREDRGYIYASSDGNWERNMLNVLNTIYREELWEINPERFNVRRAFTIYQ